MSCLWVLTGLLADLTTCIALKRACSTTVFPIELCRGDRHQNFPVLVEFEKQTDGTRRRRRRAYPDVESRFSKNNYTLNIPYITTNQRRGVAVKLIAPWLALFMSVL